jgi:hypothetical protein
MALVIVAALIVIPMLLFVVDLVRPRRAQPDPFAGQARMAADREPAASTHA